YTVFGIGKGICRLEINHEKFQYIELDLTNHLLLKNVFNRIRPDIIIHAAANSKPDDCEIHQASAFATNVSTTETLLQLAYTTKSRFIYLSTDFVFDGNSGLYSESDQRNPINYYGKTKLLSEDLVMQYNYSFSIIRTVLVYGKPLSGRQNILSIIYNKLKNKESIQLVNDQFRTPTYIKDLVWAIIQILQLNKTGIWHISGDKPLLSPYQMGIQLAKICQLDASLIKPVNQTIFNEVAVRPKTTGLNIQKAKMELNYCPTPFNIAIKEIFDL
ncbi:MAG: NAD(P)-dependent oxidoreductase, partial [Pseudopedobacter saltans]